MNRSLRSHVTCSTRLDPTRALTTPRVGLEQRPLEHPVSSVTGLLSREEGARSGRQEIDIDVTTSEDL